jgi:hypothetical protein
MTFHPENAGVLAGDVQPPKSGCSEKWHIIDFLSGRSFISAGEAPALPGRKVLAGQRNSQDFRFEE